MRRAHETEESVSVHVNSTVIEGELTRFDIHRNRIEYEVLIEKRQNDSERPIQVTVTNKKNRKDPKPVELQVPNLESKKSA